MSTTKSREVRLKRRPEGLPQPDDFELAEVSVREPRDGELLIRNIWMSVDPYMRIRMWDRETYAERFHVGEPMTGACVGQVVKSRHDRFSAGEYVTGMQAWREFWISDGTDVHKVDSRIAPLRAFLGPLGMPGLTAYVGMKRIAGVRSGERVFITAAVGAVGSIAGQIGKIAGCHVVGSTGSDEKVAWLLDKAGIDAAFNYKNVDDFGAALDKECPDGIDVYFDNVGGAQMEAVLDRMNDHGRIAACGMISQYNTPMSQPGPRNLFQFISKRLRMQGFLVLDHGDLRDEFHREMGRWISEGRVQWRESVAEGLENAAGAFIGLFQGENLGKMLVKIGSEPVA